WHGRCGDLDLLARVPRVDAGARRAPRHVELAEAGEGDVSTLLQRVADRSEHGVHCGPGVLLGQPGARCHLVDELTLGHVEFLLGWEPPSTLAEAPDTKPHIHAVSRPSGNVAHLPGDTR